MKTYPTEQEAETASEQESVRMISTGEYIDFEGQNCEPFESSCFGWDGNDRRCDCGNRRVGWLVDQVRPGVWSFYAAAW